jgi:hypothetical protein
MEELHLLLSDPRMTEGEISLLKWQYRQHGHFFSHLWEAICKADESNLDRLGKGFPSHVAAYRDFADTGAFTIKIKKILGKE